MAALCDSGPALRIDPTRKRILKMELSATLRNLGLDTGLAINVLSSLKKRIGRALDKRVGQRE
eukprot:9775102-Karenia_brevis.AAC.1